jgi:predicted nucleic acid-binding protein
MPNNITIAVWDACVVIDAIVKTPGRYEMIEPFLVDDDNGKFRIVLSEFTVGEVTHLSGLDGKLTRNQQRELIFKWLDHSWITRRAVHPGVSRKAAELGDQYKIQHTGDMYVVATAVMDKIPLIHTFDGCGKNIEGLISFDNKIGDPLIRITTPIHPDGILFAQSQGQPNDEPGQAKKP